MLLLYDLILVISVHSILKLLTALTTLVIKILKIAVTASCNHNHALNHDFIHLAIWFDSEKIIIEMHINMVL